MRQNAPASVYLCPVVGESGPAARPGTGGYECMLKFKRELELLIKSRLPRKEGFPVQELLRM